MKQLSIIAILIMAVLIAGCGVQTTFKGDEGTTKDYYMDKAKEIQDIQKGVDLPDEESEDPVDDVDEPEEHRTVSTTDGDSVTFKKLPDYTRDKTVTETCNLDYPIECPKFIAVNGIEYLTLKNAGYGSKINDVVLKLDGEECDPVGSYIEPGQVKEFECFADPDADGIVRGNLEFEYYSPMESRHFLRTGKLIVRME